MVQGGLARVHQFEAGRTTTGADSTSKEPCIGHNDKDSHGSGGLGSSSAGRKGECQTKQNFVWSMLFKYALDLQRVAGAHSKF